MASILTLSFLFFTACGDQGGGQAASNLNGAGASFPAPVYNEMFQRLAQDPGIQVNYQSIGSSGGREQFINKTVDFGASDAPMSSQEEQQRSRWSTLRRPRALA
jgi:phosphate transport system substrate-binding protein